jgi:hypothetical protein
MRLTLSQLVQHDLITLAASTLTRAVAIAFAWRKAKTTRDVSLLW